MPCTECCTVQDTVQAKKWQPPTNSWITEPPKNLCRRRGGGWFSAGKRCLSEASCFSKENHPPPRQPARQGWGIKSLNPLTPSQFLQEPGNRSWNIGLRISRNAGIGNVSAQVHRHSYQTMGGQQLGHAPALVGVAGVFFGHHHRRFALVKQSALHGQGQLWGLFAGAGDDGRFLSQASFAFLGCDPVQ